MTPHSRRAPRLALVAAASGTTLLAALLVPTGAGAAVTAVTPSTGFNSEAAKTLVLKTDAAEGTDYRPGGRAVFTLTGTPSASFTATIEPGTSQRDPQVQVNLLDGGSGLGADGPVDAGTYDVAATANGVPVLGTGAGTDRGVSRFTVNPAAALSAASAAPTSLRAGQSGDLVLTGTGFERGTTVEVLRGGAVDTTVTVGAPRNDPATQADESAQGITTPTDLRRGVTLALTAPTGARDVRVTNRNGRTATCTACFSVDGAPLTGTTPAGGDNDPALGLTTITFRGTGLAAGGQPELVYDAPATTTPSPRDSLRVVGTSVRSATASSVTADFDLRNAAPTASYRPVVRNADGSSNVCECTFAVAQKPSRTTAVTQLDSDTATAGLQSSQTQSSSRSFVLTGTGFSKGLRVTVSGEGATAGPVELISDTLLRTSITTTATAAAGARNVTVTRTDGTTSAPCTGCYTVVANATPTPTPTGTATPAPGNRPETPTVTVSPGTITSQQTALVSGTAEPNTTVELYAYSRPSTDYVLVRSGPVTSAGRWSFDVKPSTNTRLYARYVRADGTRSPDSPSTVLSVRTGINLKVARTGTRTYRFTGSTLPKRSGQLVTVFYETANGRTITVRTRVAPNGTYNVTRTFSGTGTFTFFTGTGKDLSNEAGESNRVRTTIR